MTVDPDRPGRLHPQAVRMNVEQDWVCKFVISQAGNLATVEHMLWVKWQFWRPSTLDNTTSTMQSIYIYLHVWYPKSGRYRKRLMVWNCRWPVIMKISRVHIDKKWYLFKLVLTDWQIAEWFVTKNSNPASHIDYTNWSVYIFYEPIWLLVWDIHLIVTSLCNTSIVSFLSFTMLRVLPW